MTLFTNLHVTHFCTTLWYIFNVPHFYLVNVPHFWLMYHMFPTICSMFYTLSITLFTFLKTLLCQCLYLSFKHLMILKTACIKLYTPYYFLKLYFATYLTFIKINSQQLYYSSYCLIAHLSFQKSNFHNIYTL